MGGVAATVDWAGTADGDRKIATIMTTKRPDWVRREFIGILSI